MTRYVWPEKMSNRLKALRNVYGKDMASISTKIRDYAESIGEPELTDDTIKNRLFTMESA